MTAKDYAQDGIFDIPRNQIHPDPDQPRVKVDTELQSSIDSEGIIQAITVRPHPAIENEWMIVDGERRYLGGAHLKTIPCRIRLDLEESVTRLITQLAANSGKPLSPIEQARAFKKALEEGEKKLSQAELAKRLGIPRSTIGDRIRLMELHPVWMKLIESGELQPSHAPVLHRLVGVPAKYQLEAAAAAKKAYWWGENMQVDDFVYQIEDIFKPYIHPLQKGPYGGGCEFNPKHYEGPTVMVREGMRGTKTILYAADPEIWKPLVNAARAEKSKKTREMRKNASTALSRSGKKLKIDVPEGTPIKVLKGYERKLPGHVQLTTWQCKWEIDNGSRYDPAVLLDHLDRSKLVIVQGYDEPQVWTADTDAFSIARSKWEERWKARREELRQEVAALFGSMPITAPNGDASRKLVRNILAGRSRDGIADLRDMAAIAKTPLPKKLAEGWCHEQLDLADAWLEKLTGPQAIDCLRVLLAIYYLAEEGPTQRAEAEELHERNRLASHVAPFFPERLAKQIAEVEAGGKNPDSDDLDDEADDRSYDVENDLVDEEELVEA